MNHPSKYPLKGCYWYSTVVLTDNLSWIYHLCGKKRLLFACLPRASVELKRPIKGSILSDTNIGTLGPFLLPFSRIRKQHFNTWKIAQCPFRFLKSCNKRIFLDCNTVVTSLHPRLQILVVRFNSD